MKIALFGGSFDPPHAGHQGIVNSALQNLDIEKLIIMPAFINPFKRSFCADAKQRFLWSKKIWGGLDGVELCDFEIKQNRPVPTIESVEYLEKLYQVSKFYCIIGADHLAHLQTWHSFEKLAKKVEFVIVCRDNITIPNHFKKLNVNIPISSSFIRESLDTRKVSALIKESVDRFYAGCKKAEKDSSQERIRAIVEILDSKKAENIENFDMRGGDYFASFVVIASTLGEKHALALIDALKTQLKARGEEFLRIESSDQWSVLDLGDIIIHLLSPQYRDLYSLEAFLQGLKNEIHSRH